MTPFEWKSMTIGKSYDSDKAYGFQCWDYFDAFVKYFKLPVSTYCSLTGYVCDLWRLKEKYGYSKYFDFVTDWKQLRDGDWVLWDKGSASHNKSHICMYFAPDIELGQNQGSTRVNEKVTTFTDMMGAFRFRGWSQISTGASDITINGHSYSLYRQKQNQKTVVLSAGLNKLASIRDLDADVKVMAKITGANYFQMKTDQADPVGTTYGDISAPLNDVWRMLPNQNNTLYFDIETGVYGDCTGIRIDKTHNVFSPGCVFPAQGNYQYGTFIGINCVNIVSRYSFLIRFTDGTYAVGIANEDLSPKQIATDFKQYAIDSIAFLDGGGSAQMGRVNNGIFEYNVINDRKMPSAVAIISTEPLTPSDSHENEPIQDESQKDEETPTENENKPETGGNEPTALPEPEPVPEWKDPEPQTGVITERVAALMSVKSILTLALTAVFAYLVIHQIAIPDLFNEIYKIVILFFFGYQTGKAQNGGNK